MSIMRGECVNHPHLRLDAPLDAPEPASYTRGHMPKLILGIVGLQGCGKGTLADILVKEYHAGYFRFSAILSDTLGRLAIERSRDNFNKLSITLRKAFGEDVLSYAVESAALAAPQNLVVIDGIRRPEDIVGLEPLPNFHLIAIEADAKLRYDRMRHRGEKATESNLSWEDFLANEADETEKSIPFAMARAKYRIANNGTREDFEREAHALIQALLNDHSA